MDTIHATASAGEPAPPLSYDAWAEAYRTHRMAVEASLLTLLRHPLSFPPLKLPFS